MRVIPTLFRLPKKLRITLYPDAVKKRVLIIAYYFPPMGGSGVQRPVKFAKYLKKKGWDPVVLAPQAGAYLAADESLELEIAESGIRVERVGVRGVPQSLIKGKKTVRYTEFAGRMLRLFTSWFMLPDNKKGWIEPAVKRAEKLLNEEHFDAVFATAPPYSNLIIAARLKDRFDITVVMDLRDDWLNSHLIRYPTSFHRSKMTRLEKETLEKADAITVVNAAYKKGISERIELSAEITVIPNGFDPDDFAATENQDEISGKMKFLYSGLFYGKRQPDHFLKALKMAAEQSSDFATNVIMQFQGGLEKRHLNLIQKLELEEIVTDLGYLSHKEAVQNLVKSDALVLIMAEQPHAGAVTTGKMFEYFGSTKPVLAMIPPGESEQLLNEYGSSFISGPEDVTKTAENLLNMYSLWETQSFPDANIEFIKQFDRNILSEKLSDVVSNLIQ